MARRTRKRRRRGAGPPPNLAAKARGEAPERPASSRPRGEDERPPAPWGSFPLVEIVVLVALVLLIGGFVVSGTQGAVMIGTGLALGSLGGLELSIREHLAGYRSHTLLLAGSAAIVVLAALFFFGPSALPPVARIAVVAAVFVLAAWGLSSVFRRRSGGYAFRVRGFRG